MKMMILISIVMSTCLNAGEIHNAAAAGDLDKVKVLLEADPTLLEARDGRGNTPLFMACIRYRVDVAYFLIDQGAVVDARNNANQNPLHAANGVFGQDIGLIKRLIAEGADVNAKGDRGDTPLSWAAAQGNLEVAQLLIDLGADPGAYDVAFGSILHNTINQDHPGMAKLLIQNGAKLNQQDPSDRTELHLAAIRGNAELTQLLIKSNVDKDAVDRHNRTALYYAAKHGYRSVTDILIDAGANQGSIVESNYGYAPQLTVPLKDGEAWFWYLGSFAGDGYAVKTKKHLLLFDPPGMDQSPESGLANGHLNPDELAGQKITVFISKPDWERYPLDCFRLAEHIPDVDLVIGFKPESKLKSKDPVPSYRLAKSNESFNLGDIHVQTIPATLDGIAYLVDVDGLKVFYAGYHASNNASQDTSYQKEVNFLKTLGPIDVAILAVGGHHIDSYTYHSYLYMVDHLSPKAVYLMHGTYNYDAYLELAKLLESHPVIVKYPEGTAGGDRFHFLQD